MWYECDRCGAEGASRTGKRIEDRHEYRCARCTCDEEIAIELDRLRKRVADLEWFIGNLNLPLPGA